MPLQAATDALRMIEAPSRSRGRAFCTVKKSPLTLVLNSLSNCASPQAAERASHLGEAGVGEEDVHCPYLFSRRRTGGRGREYLRCRPACPGR